MKILPLPDAIVARIASPLGPLDAVISERGLHQLEFGEGDAGPAGRERHPHLETLRRELDAYFAGTLRSFSVPLIIEGTDFQQRVWAELCRIPYGETRSYEDVAREVGDAKAVRAVGTANGRNRLAIIVPCHRVINKGGGLGGYGGGLDRKQFLLDLERGRGV